MPALRTWLALLARFADIISHCRVLQLCRFGCLCLLWLPVCAIVFLSTLGERECQALSSLVFSFSRSPILAFCASAVISIFNSSPIRAIAAADFLRLERVSRNGPIRCIICSVRQSGAFMTLMEMDGAPLSGRMHYRRVMITCTNKTTFTKKESKPKSL